MASRFIEGAVPRGRNTLDVPVAALAGLSVAFVAFAAPPEMLARLVETTGLAAMLPGAEPPLGPDARIAIAAAGAVLVFAIAFLLLRWLDRFGTRSSAAADEDPDMETPRLRRRDFHPDARACRPILAAHELSEPESIAAEPEILLDELAPEAEAVAARPAWLAPAEAVADGPESEAPEAASVPRHGTSIADLLERLEQGLARRRSEPAPPPSQPAAAAAAPPQVFPETAAPPPQVFPEPADGRLQSAIDSLQRLAARHD